MAVNRSTGPSGRNLPFPPNSFSFSAPRANFLVTLESAFARENVEIVESTSDSNGRSDGGGSTSWRFRSALGPVDAPFDLNFEPFQSQRESRYASTGSPFMNFFLCQLGVRVIPVGTLDQKALSSSSWSDFIGLVMSALRQVRHGQHAAPAQTTSVAATWRGDAVSIQLDERQLDSTGQMERSAPVAFAKNRAALSSQMTDAVTALNEVVQVTLGSTVTTTLAIASPVPAELMRGFVPVYAAALGRAVRAYAIGYVHGGRYLVGSSLGGGGP